MNKIDAVAVLTKMRESIFDGYENGEALADCDSHVLKFIDKQIAAISATAHVADGREDRVRMSELVQQGIVQQTGMTERAAIQPAGAVAELVIERNCFGSHDTTRLTLIKRLDAGTYQLYAAPISKPSTPPELAVHQAHELLTKYCVADLSNGYPATLVERIQELYSWYENLVQPAAPISEGTRSSEG